MTSDCIGPLLRAGIDYDDALALRRIAMTLHRWHEMECGINDGCVERDEPPLTWHSAMNRWHDQTGIAHLMNAQGAALCGARPHSLGGGFTRAEDGGAHACEACQRIAAKPGKTYWHNASSGRRWPIPDREAGAKKRLAAIMERYPRFSAYIQGDPRGAALYILRPGDVPQGEDADAYYSRGLAVYK